jgi:hypothetical protein
MGMHCPNCHSRVSHIQQLKIPIHFNGGKRKHQNYEKRHPRLFPNPTSLINNSVEQLGKTSNQ